MSRIVKGNRIKGEENLNRIKAYQHLDPRESKCKELEVFGISREMIQRWENGNNPEAGKEYGKRMNALLGITREVMQRTKPSGCTKLGLYIDSIKKILQTKFKYGTILDFGCGAWVDASLSLALDSDLTIQLMDILPLSLAFASYQLARRGISHSSSLVTDIEKEINLVKDDLVMIVESTSFEHVKGLNKLFRPLMEKLPSGGLFLTNYTRLDWSRRGDGYDENKKFAGKAVTIANELAERYEWIPLQDKANGWDLWEKK